MNATEQTEKERKFLLKEYPDILNIDNYWDDETEVIKSNIDQYYLEDGSRIRKATIQDPENGVYRNLRVKFTHTRKTGKGDTRKEIIEEIDLEEFSELREQAISEIRKTREEVKFDDHNLVLDAFKNINLVLLEIEVIPEVHDHSELYSIGVPNRITSSVIMEVTPYEEFKNKNLAVKL